MPPAPKPAHKVVKKTVGTIAQPSTARSARDATPVFRPKQEEPGTSALVKFGLPAIVIVLVAAVFVWWKFFRGA
jgi:hypothetical protein